MKHLPALFASASLWLAAAAAAKAESTDLVVEGSIVPGAACNVTIGGGPLNLGTISREMLNPDPSKPTRLEEHGLKTLVDCANPARFAFVVTEARGGDPALPEVFKMYGQDGFSSPGKLFLLFDAQSTMIDGVQGYVTGSNEGTTDLGNATWGPATPFQEDLPITNGRYAVGFVRNAESMDAPDPLRNLRVDLLVRPVINPLNNLDLSGDIAFSSDIGLEIRYF
ncbi:hypothetical protein [Luteibacter yeojuensis]